MCLKCPQYKLISSSINREVNKNMPLEIKNVEDKPNEHEYYKTLDNKSFFLYRDENIIIFQSKFQALLHLKYKDIIFCDRTFYVAPSIAYQLVITGIYSKYLHSFFTSSYSLMNNKEQKIMNCYLSI